MCLKGKGGERTRQKRGERRTRRVYASPPSARGEKEGRGENTSRVSVFVSMGEIRSERKEGKKEEEKEKKRRRTNRPLLFYDYAGKRDERKRKVISPHQERGEEENLKRKGGKKEGEIRAAF